jgi:hypothetical protein
MHDCQMESVSRKYALFTEQWEQLRERGMSKRRAMCSLLARPTAPLEDEWLEAFWCPHCARSTWYHVRRRDRRHQVQVVSSKMWQQAIGVLPPNGLNPSVSEFSQREAHHPVLRG